MGTNVTELMDELQKTKQNLSEVIDECVFVERQRDLTEQKLTAELGERDRLVADSLSALMSLIDYLSLLEKRVIIPALGAFNVIVNKIPEISTNRSSTLERVEGVLSAHNIAHFREILSRMQPLKGEIEIEIQRALLENPLPFSMEEAYVLIRALLEEKNKLLEKTDDAMLRVNSIITRTQPLRSISPSRSDEVRELKQKVTALMQELESRDHEKREAAHRFAVLHRALEEEDKSAGELYRLRETIERQEKIIEQLRLTIASSTRAKSDIPSFNGHIYSSMGDEKEGSLISQLKANELTIGTLNRELAILEDNYRNLEKRSAKEREDLQAELVSERTKYREEQAECDSVLGRVTMELEQLVAENAQLKKRLKEKHNKKKTPQKSIL
ncbi:uncharacterized protein TM35_000041460 [Trypanosoma theileri]|uniref:Uncharacterized protein n=1 Tax=Trypanosoma theileri TaxID=67003 RepID=A0A1X0P4S8_9TRYP|nr:uncharacterized protein TM35_000041460 [Trypanosoma theileri]ORC91932.1 hypothetical protein TM35_000041460 [Trypanosoma theileri]